MIFHMRRNILKPDEAAGHISSRKRDFLLLYCRTHQHFSHHVLCGWFSIDFPKLSLHAYMKALCWFKASGGDFSERQAFTATTSSLKGCSELARFPCRKLIIHPLPNHEYSEVGGSQLDKRSETVPKWYQRNFKPDLCGQKFRGGSNLLLPKQTSVSLLVDWEGRACR